MSDAGVYEERIELLGEQLSEARAELDRMQRERDVTNEKRVRETITLVQERDALAAEVERLRELLGEARGMLCEHAELRDLGARAWCSHCNQYLRSDEERTLNARIDAALEGGDDE